MCVIMVTTATGSDGYPSLFPDLFCVLVHSPEQPIGVISVTNESTPTRHIDSLWQPWQVPTPARRPTVLEPYQDVDCGCM